MTINLINSSSAHFGAVRYVAFDPSNEKIISIGEDEGRLYIWNADTLSPATGNTIEEKTGNYMVRAAVFSGEYSFLFGGDNKSITLVDWPDCENYSTYLQSDEDINFMSLKWDTKTVAYSDQHLIRFHDKENNNIPDISIENDIVWLEYSRDAKFFAICSDSTVIIWNAKDFTEIFRKKYDIGTCHPSWGPADFLIIPTSSPGKVIILKVETLEEHEVQNPSDELAATTAVALSNKFMLAISDISNQISFLQLNQDYSLTPFSKTKYSGSEFTSIQWGNVNTNLFAAGDTEGTIFLFEIIESKKQENKEQEDATDSDVQLDIEKDENKKADSQSSSKTINDVLKDKPNLIIKPRTQPKKAKGKGKQQKLNLGKAPVTSKSKKVDLKRRFISDNSDSSEEEEENENKENEIIKEQNKKTFLDDEDVNLDEIDNIEKSTISKPQKSFLNDDENDDVFDDVEGQKKQLSPKTKKSFLSDNDNNELDDIDMPNSSHMNAEIPGYDDIALPDDDDDDIAFPEDSNNALPEDKNIITDNEKTEEKVNDTLENKNPNLYSSINYLDCSSSNRFMPGSFKQQNGKTEILCWNGEGSIVMYNPGFTDKEKYVKIQPYGNSSFYSKTIDEAYEINLGTVDEYGYLIATNNTVIYHRHNEYGPESEIIKNFAFLEDIQLLACGRSFFAVATARKFLHIFSSAGVELSVFALNGRLITMVGHENYLFVVSGKHHFDLFDVPNRSLLASGILPIHAPLRWAGFNHFDHSVVIESGNYQLLNLSYANGIRWTPVVDLSNHLESSTNGLLHLFIVEVYGNQVSGVYLDKDVDELETDPFPETLKDIDFQPPTIESLLDNCVLSIVNYQNSNDKDKEAKRFDRELLKKFDSALKEDKLLLATQMAKQMKTAQGIDLAIELCDRRGHSGVSERLIQFKDMKREEEDYDESSDFEIDESTEEPEPFVRTEKIQNDDDDDQIEKTNIFLGRFHSEKEINNNDANNENDNDSNVEEIKDQKTKESESSDDDLDKIDDDDQKVSQENMEKKTKRNSKENKSKAKKLRNKASSKSKRHTKADDDDIDQSNDDEIDNQKQNESSDENDQKEKKKNSSDKNDKKKPPKSKPARKKLFNSRNNTSNMSALDAFGFS